MRSLIVLLCWAAVAGLAQAPPAEAPPPAGNLMTLPPDTVVATIDGQKVRALELQLIMRGLSPQIQQLNLRNPENFLEQYGFMRRLSEMAEKSGLDQKSPLKEQLEYNRLLAMAQAQLQETQEQTNVSSEETEKFYQSNLDRFTQARLKVIYIPFSANPPAQTNASGKKVLSESDAKAKVEQLYDQLQAGTDFVKLVKENSEDATSAAKDGDFGSITRTDQTPAEIKAAVFALKPGEVTKPLRRPNGFYIFRLEEMSLKPLNEVREQIVRDLVSRHMDEWVNDLKKKIEIKIVNPAILPAAPTPAPAK